MLTANRASLLQGDETLDDAFDLSRVFAVVSARRWWVIGCVVLSTAASVALAHLWPPTYQASVVLAPTVAERGGDVLGLGGLAGASGLGGLASIAGLALGPKEAETEEALAVLQSREFTDKFIADRNLMQKFYVKKWDAANGRWKVSGDDVPTPARAYKYFNKQVRSVTRDKKAGLVTLHINWRNRNEAADWANDLVRLLNEDMRARAIAKADAAMHFLEAELAKTNTVEGRSAISRLMEAQLKQRMLANVTPDYSFRVIDPALPPDRDDPVWPLKSLLIMAGLLCGFLIGVLGVYYLDSSQSRRSARAKG